MRQLLIPILGLILLASCGDRQPISINKNQFSEEEVKAEVAAANAFFDRKFDEAVDRSPQWQSYLGIKKDYGKLDEVTEASIKADHKFYQGILQEAKDSIDFAKLDKETQLSYKLFELFCEDKIKEYKWRFHEYKINQMHGAQATLPAFLINVHKVKSYDDAMAYLNRLEELGRRIRQHGEWLEKQENKGIMPPKFVYDHVINDCKNLISGFPLDNSGVDNTLYADFTKKVDGLEDVGDENKKALKMGCEKRLKGEVEPAYKKLIKICERQQAKTTEDDGVWKMPDGADYFNYRLGKMTTTDLSAEQIHEIGLSEVERIHKEMEAIMKEVKYDGTLQEFFKFMKKDKQFYYADTKEGRGAYLDKANEIIDAMRPKLDELFITKPKAELIVKAVEPFREKSAGKAFYQSPAPDGSRPGTYYANTYKMEAMPKYQMEALAYHEAIPGHHMQLSIAQEMEGMPKFRRFAGNFTAYLEGWGLYSEFLPKEIGFYEDPYSDFGRLAMELWRACRLVVDTGIHAKKWTRQEGIDYYVNNSPNAKSDCVKMVERHIVMPGQATAYKIGMIKILELREDAKQKLGDKFDIREFHEVVLTNGAVPLDILGDLVDEWVASKG